MLRSDAGAAYARCEQYDELQQRSAEAGVRVATIPTMRCVCLCVRCVRALFSGWLKGKGKTTIFWDALL